MKVKRFNNLWAMGLILFGAILVAFYVIKIFCPEFIVGVAEIPAIVKFGQYIDNNKWAYYLVESIVAFTVGFIYCCACCRRHKLSWKSCLVILGFIIILHLVPLFIPHQFTILNCAVFVLMPFIVCIVEKNICKETFISTIVCIVADLIIQVATMEIRDITIMATQYNYATYFILLIDVIIWRFFFYSFFNYKTKRR